LCEEDKFGNFNSGCVIQQERGIQMTLITRVRFVDLAKELATQGYTYEALFQRFKKFSNLIDLSPEDYKDENGEISFHEEEKELIKALLLEMGEPYLIKITSKKLYGKYKGHHRECHCIQRAHA
jgi:hypothetical protein